MEGSFFFSMRLLLPVVWRECFDVKSHVKVIVIVLLGHADSNVINKSEAEHIKHEYRIYQHIKPDGRHMLTVSWETFKF